MTLLQANQILGKEDDSTPWTVVDQKSPGKIGLKENCSQLILFIFVDCHVLNNSPKNKNFISTNNFPKKLMQY